MPAGRHKSRTLRRVYKRVPSGGSKLFYIKRKPSKAQCAVCGAVLKGILTARIHVMKNTPKSKKRPQRPYGGCLCSACMRRRIIQISRSK